MKKAVLLALLISVLLPAAAFARDSDHKVDPKQMELDFQRERHNLELQKMKADNEFEIQRRNFELERERKEMDRRMDHDGHKDGGPGVLILLVLFVLHILCAVWVYMDVKARKSDAGIWIVLTLLSGLFGALIYGIIRVGDARAAEEEGKAAKK